MTKPILNKKPNVENAVFTFIHSIIPDCKIHPLMDFLSIYSLIALNV